MAGKKIGRKWKKVYKHMTLKHRKWKNEGTDKGREVQVKV
jgi:hypothetical protein